MPTPSPILPTPPNPPRIVAIETSGRTGSLALGLGNQILDSETLSATTRHAAELLPTLDTLTRRQGWLPPDIDHLYLSLGPGSFTGLRIAVAAARAIAQATGCRLVGVPSLDVLAQNAPADFRFVLPILDAKRGQVFSALYERLSTGELMRRTDPALVDPAAFLAAVPRLPGVSIALLGEGLDYHRSALAAQFNDAVVELDRSFWIAQATHVYRLGYAAAQANHFSDPETLIPIYIRLAEAEEVWRKKRGLPL